MISAASARLQQSIQSLSIICAIISLLVIDSAVGQRRPGFQPSTFAIERVDAFIEGKMEKDVTIILRRGSIADIGRDVAIPGDAERIDGKGLVAYPGFIDAYSNKGIDPKAARSRTGSGQSIDYSSFALGATPPDNRNGLTPEFLVAEAVALESKDAESARAGGFTSGVLIPSGGISTGQSALVAYNSRPRREVIVQSPLGLHIALRSTGKPGYPGTLMGMVAHLRQAMLDASHYDALWSHYRLNGGPRPPQDPTLEALRKAQKGELKVFWEAHSRDQIHRALDLAKEFGVKPTIVGGREAWKVADRLAATKTPVVLRIDFSDKPEEPTQPTKDADAKDGKKKELPKSHRVYLDQLERWEERIKGVAKLANSKVRFCLTSAGNDKLSKFHENLRLCVEHGLTEIQTVNALTADAADILGTGDRVGKLEKDLAAHLVVYNNSVTNKDAKLRYAFIDRDKFEFNKPKESKAKEDSKPKPSDIAKTEPTKENDKEDGEKAEDKKDKKTKPAEETYPTEVRADRIPSLKTNGNLAITNVTIIPVTKPVEKKGTILIQAGKIKAIGADVKVPKNIKVLDGKGLYAMPGMVDTHTHIGISGGVNESTLSVVPEVRVKDVVYGDTLSIYRAAAGGLTTARLLHGSANPIGGQDAVIKLKYGEAARDMILHERPRGVKFALGENPKRSTTRYPDTRLGVEAVIRRAFEEGRMYRRVWQLYAAAKARGEKVPEPRRDLRLEALSHIVNKELFIHCHCYRADEILMLMRLAESYGIRIRSLQHVLEGYKVAAEIAAHGASTSTFSDWWAYKVEAFDAIPHNAALLEAAGAEVTVKSDDSELMRHMNQEAAKTMRYGGLTANQALRTVTITAARQIGLDHRIGSLEVGKDADIALFDGHPLNLFSRCEFTIIDGEVYFQRRKRSDRASVELPVADGTNRPDVRLPADSPKSFALTNAHIVPVNGEVIQRGSVIVQDGKIVSVSEKVDGFAPEIEVVDMNGLSIYPGMINLGGTVGLSEIRSVKETQDYSERGDYNSDLRASVALHPDSAMIPVTRANGVLTTLTQPRGGTISGQSALINLAGWIAPEMTVRDPGALHVNFPRGSYGADESSPSAKNVQRLKERFELALRYDKLRRRAKKDPSVLSQIDPKLEALAPFASGEGLVIVHAFRHGDILAATEFAQSLKLKWILSGASDAWKCVDFLKKHDVKVVLGPTMTTARSTGAPYDATYQTASMLHKAGVQFAIEAGSNASRVRNLPFQAAMSVSYGLPADIGLKAVTIYPAQLIGVDDKLGSIEEGKIANLVITDGNMLQPATQVKGLVVDGKLMPPTSRHTHLFDRYEKRLNEVKDGKAKLGVGKGKQR